MLRRSMIVLIALAVVSCGGTSSSPPVADRGATPGRSARSSPPALPPAAIQGAEGRIPMLTLARADTTLAAHGKRVTVLAMWAAWCKPCIEELPYIDAR